MNRNPDWGFAAYKSAKSSACRSRWRLQAVLDQGDGVKDLQPKSALQLKGSRDFFFAEFLGSTRFAILLRFVMGRG